MKKILFVLLPVLFLSSAFSAFAISGIPKESVWMSEKSPEEGEIVTLFTFVFNGQESDNLYGDIERYDEDTILIEDSEAPPLLFFVANKIEEKEVELSEDKIFADLDNLENKIISSTPPVVAETIGESFGFLEETRNEVKNIIFEEIAQVEEKSEELSAETNTEETAEEGEIAIDTKKEESPAVKYVEKPALGVYKFSLNSLYFILSSALLTYGLLIFFVYLISRFAYRKIRKK